MQAFYVSIVDLFSGPDATPRSARLHKSNGLSKPRTLNAGTIAKRESVMSVLPFDKRDGVIWMNGVMLPWAEAKLHVLSHGLALWFVGVRGRAGLWRRHLQVARTFRAVLEFGAHPRFRDPLFRRGAGPHQGMRSWRPTSHTRLLRAADRLARQRDDGGRRAERDGQRGDHRPGRGRACST